MHTETEQKESRKKQIKVILIIAFSILFVAGATWGIIALVKHNRKKKEADKLKQQTDQPKKDKDDGPGRSSSGLPLKGEGFPLDVGSNGNNVLYLQRALNRIQKHLHPSAASIKEDGILGDGTYKSVIYNIGTKYFPVTEESWEKILQQSEQYI